MSQGKWIRKDKNGINAIFIHGINSSEDCWKNKNGSYWPTLLENERKLADIGIYIFSYRTGLNTGFYSLSDIVDSLREYFRVDNLIGSKGVVFVCHSMGGIVARRFLINQYSTLIKEGLNKIGLFLVASPSLGSDYANMLGLISGVMGHTQASALKFSQSNVWLNDLDKDFINLMANKDLQIRGKELIEDLPLYGKGFIKRQVVAPFSGARYFGNSFKVPGSDHSTIATPADRDAIQHRLLVEFITEFIQEESGLNNVRGSNELVASQKDNGLPSRQELKNVTGISSEEAVFPAKDEDEAKLLRARDMILSWRNQYADKVSLLSASSKQAREWMKQRPKFNDDVYQVITLAATVAEDFRSLPISELEFARPYGLSVHPTVFWGQAIGDVLTQALLYTPEARENRKKLNEALGVFQEEEVPNQYGFEMIARILESGLALTSFNINALPRGYLNPTGQTVSGDLSTCQQLFIVQFGNEPGLHLIDVEQGIKRIGSFTARNLGLYTLSAQRNQEGSLDLVAHDWEHLYYWKMSSQLPTMEFTCNKNTILDACFISSEPGALVAIVEKSGSVKLITPDGRCRNKALKLAQGQNLECAKIWIDPLKGEDWYIVALNNKNEIVSGLHGDFSTTKSGDDLWDAPIFKNKFRCLDISKNLCSLEFGILDGFPCLIIEGKSGLGHGETGVFFLDPKTLQPIRSPLAICNEFVGTMTIAAERWLVVGLLSEGQFGNRILVWDLDNSSNEPLGGWFEEQGDIYSLTVVVEDSNSFQTVQIFRTFDPSSNQAFKLCKFHWPSGDVEMLGSFAGLKIWPVTSK